MTALSKRKTRLTFETDTCVRGYANRKGKRGRVSIYREIVVEPEPLMCVIRLKGTRQRFYINWITIYEHAAQLAADRQRFERKQARKLRRKQL